MDLTSAGEQLRMGKCIRGWLVGIGCLWVLYLVLGWFDNTTELSPSHDGVLLACFAIAGVSGLASGIVGTRNSKNMTVWRRAALVFGLSMLGFLSVAMVSIRTATIVEGLIDFPPDKTKTYTTLILISRAYQTHGKGRSWNIQTTPIWSDLEITKEDYEFMRTHRRIGDNTTDPDEISSKGYFCAHVRIQQSGNALRVLHAGSLKLPKGSVVICASQSDP